MFRQFQMMLVTNHGADVFVVNIRTSVWAQPKWAGRRKDFFFFYFNK